MRELESTRKSLAQWNLFRHFFNTIKKRSVGRISAHDLIIYISWRFDSLDPLIFLFIHGLLRYRFGNIYFFIGEFNQGEEKKKQEREGGPETQWPAFTQVRTHRLPGDMGFSLFELAACVRGGGACTVIGRTQSPFSLPSISRGCSYLGINKQL